MHFIVPGWLCLPSSGAIPIRLVNENGMTGTIYCNPSSDHFKEKKTRYFLSRFNLQCRTEIYPYGASIQLACLFIPDPLKKTFAHTVNTAIQTTLIINQYDDLSLSNGGGLEASRVLHAKISRVITKN